MLIGIDIQEAERVRKYIGTDRMAKMFTLRELDYMQNKNWAPETVSGIFCAKEAFFKAIGTGVNISRLLDVEVKHAPAGAPYYNLSPSIISENHLGTARISLSISHTKTTAVAVCVILRLGELI